MAISKFEEDVNLISKLADKPNETNNLSADQLKARFDKAAGLIKSYLNSTLTEELDDLFEDLNKYIDDSVAALKAKVWASFLSLDGGTMSGTINVGDGAHLMEEALSFSVKSEGVYCTLLTAGAGINGGHLNISHVENGTVASLYANSDGDGVLTLSKDGTGYTITADDLKNLKALANDGTGYLYRNADGELTWEGLG